jgi:hypothetical protein
MISSDLPGVNPATLNGMILYYHLMTQWSGLGDSTKLSRMGLSQVLTSKLGDSLLSLNDSIGCLFIFVFIYLSLVASFCYFWYNYFF